MYPSHLGKFNVPSSEVPDWPARITYTPEPPITVRSSMNPWQTEREREIYLAEESAWKAIVPKQVQFRVLYAQALSLMNQYNSTISQLEGLVGRPIGLQKVSSIAASVPVVGQAVGMITGLLDSVLGMLTGGFLGGSAKKKKQQGEALIRQLESLQAALAAVQQQLYTIQSEIEGLLRTAEGIRSSQPSRTAAAMAQSETAYQQARSLDTIRAGVLRERIRQVNLLPRPTGGPSNDL